MLNVCDVTHYSYVRVNGFLTNRRKHYEYVYKNHLRKLLNSS